MHGLPSFLELVLLLAVCSSPLWAPGWGLALYFWLKARRLAKGKRR